MPSPGDDTTPEELMGRLVGLTATEASDAVAAAGLDPVLVDPGTTALTMDYRPQRVRLFLDDAGLVERATQG